MLFRSSEQQYWEAEQAFRRVTEINPEYADGYINIALAQYSQLVGAKREGPDGVGNMSTGVTSTEKFNPGLKQLARALALSPGNPRALYYRGLFYRLQQRYDAAVEAQCAIISAYPRMRQARQELGYTYYLQKRYDLARAQFETLQSINPDDLTAHFYLSLIYDRLGLKDQAATEAAVYAEHKEDPTVGRIAQDFWRRYPAVADELSPYHLHGTALQNHPRTTVGGPLP